MALVPKTAYPSQTNAADPGYPQGKAQNVSTPGDGTGTPYTADIVNDQWGWQQALLAAAGITPSGVPDEVGASDYLDALDALYPAIGRMTTAEADIVALEASRVTGPGSSTDNAIARFDGTTGKVAQNSGLQLTDADELAYTAGKSRTTIIPGTEFWAPSTTVLTAYISGAVALGCRLNVDNEIAILHLGRRFPSGAIINTMRVLVDPGAARAGADRMYATAAENTTLSFGGTPSAGSGAGVGSLVYDDTTAGLQVITLSSLSMTIDPAKVQSLIVRAGNTATASPDWLRGVEIDWTDPGPRNV